MEWQGIPMPALAGGPHSVQANSSMLYHYCNAPRASTYCCPYWQRRCGVTSGLWLARASFCWSFWSQAGPCRLPLPSLQQEVCSFLRLIQSLEGNAFSMRPLCKLASIKQSKRTLIQLHRKAVKSHWCMMRNLDQGFRSPQKQSLKLQYEIFAGPI